jgi:YggT family protein
MQEAVLFLAQTAFSLVFFVFLLRLLLQWARGDFRNPLAQAVLKLTNWLIMPLRRVLPPIRRVDTASVVAVLAIALLQVVALNLLRGFGLPDPVLLLRLAVLEIVRTILWFYFWAIFVYALLSMLAPGAYSPAQSLLESLCEPVLAPIRRVIPPLAGLDLSPLWAGILLQVLMILLPR